MWGVQSGDQAVPTIANLVVGRGGQACVRRVLALMIAIAFAIVTFQLLEHRPGGLPLHTAAMFWALPAVAGGAGIGAAILGASASPSTLAVLNRHGFRVVVARYRAGTNGLSWAAIGLLAVHFTAEAFRPLPGGPILAGAVLASVLGIATGRLHASAADHEAYRTFNLVAMLLAAGALASMSLTPTGPWWSVNFSTLGTSDDLAAACFNIAIIVAGLAMAALGPAMSRALRVPRFGLRRGGLATIRALIVLIGVSLAGVGLVPIDGATVLHNVFACTAAAGFAALAVGIRGFARWMPLRLVVFSYCAVAVEVGAMIAYDGLDLFNLTVFEIVAFSLVFAWLIALVATTHGGEHGEAARARRHLGRRRRRRGVAHPHPGAAARGLRRPPRSGRRGRSGGLRVGSSRRRDGVEPEPVGAACDRRGPPRSLPIQADRNTPQAGALASVRR